MATVNLLEAFNPDTITWLGSVTEFTSSHIQIRVGGSVFNYFGSGFTSDATGRLGGGTLLAMDYTVAGSLQFQMNGLNHSAAILDAVVRTNDSQVIQSFLFSGADIVFGSPDVDRISGFAGSDAIGGGAGHDVLRGEDGNDLFDGGTGNDSIDGGSGLDIAFYSGNRAGYTVAGTATSVHVSSAVEGADTLTDVERLLFADKSIAFDLELGESAGNAVRIIGAAFDQAAITPEIASIAIDLFDSGYSMFEVAELALSTPLFGSRSSFDFVNKVYQNIVGVLPTIPERDAYVAFLRDSGGPLSQAELLVLAASSDANAANIGLAGLQLTGVEFF